MPDQNPQASELKDKLKKLASQLAYELPDTTFLAAPSPNIVDQVNAVYKAKDSERARTDESCRSAKTEIDRLRSQAGSDKDKINEIQIKSEELMKQYKIAAELTKEAGLLKAKAELYKEYFKLSNELTTAIGQGPRDDFLKDLAHSVKEQEARRKAFAEQYRNIERKNQLAEEMKQKNRVTNWELISQNPLASADTDVSLHNEVLKKPLTAGQWRVSHFVDDKRKEMIVEVDAKGNIRLPLIADNKERMQAYRTVMRMYGAGMGCGRLTLDFPKLEDGSLKDRDQALAALSLKEVKSILTIAKEEGVEIVIDKGSQLDKWMGKLNDQERQALQKMLDECRGSYFLKAKNIPQDNEKLAHRAAEKMQDAAQKLAARQNSPDELPEAINDATTAANKIYDNLIVRPPTPAVCNQYEKAVTFAQETVNNISAGGKNNDNYRPLSATLDNLSARLVNFKQEQTNQSSHPQSRAPGSPPAG